MEKSFAGAGSRESQCQQNANRKKFRRHDVLSLSAQHTTYMLSCQSESCELREAREVFVQWLSGHSQTDKCLVDLYCTRFSMGTLSRSLFVPSILRYQNLYGISIAVAIRSLDPSLSVRLRDLLWEFYGISIAVTIRSFDLSAQLRDLLSHWDLYRGGISIALLNQSLDLFVPLIYPLA